MPTIFDPILGKLKETELPVTPENPETKFLNGNKVWSDIAIGAGGYAANLYFTTIDSDVTGYKKISYTNEVAETELSGTITSSDGDKLLRTYLFDYGISTTVVDAGVWIANFRTKVSNATGVTRLKMEVFVYHTDTTETILWSDYSPEINNTSYLTIRAENNQPSFSVSTTDRLGVRVYAATSSGSTITIYTIVGDGHASYFTTPLGIRHNQLRDLNGDPEFQHMTSTEKSLLDSISLPLPISLGGTGSATQNFVDLSTDQTILGKKTFSNDLTVNGGTFFVDTTNNRNGILTTAPTHSLTLGSTSTGIALYNTTDQTTNYERLRIWDSSGTFRIDSEAGGTGTNKTIVFASGTSSMSMNTSGINGFFRLNRTGDIGSAGESMFNITHSLNGSSGVQYSQIIQPTINQSSTAGYTALLINPTETATGSGAKLLIDIRKSGTSYFSVDNNGNTFAKQKFNAGTNINVGTANIVSLSTTQVSLFIKGITSQTANFLEIQNSGASSLIGINSSGDIVLNTSTGNKMATAIDQKLAFWNATPIVQPANTVAIDTLLVNTGLRASGGISNFGTVISAPGTYAELYVAGASVSQTTNATPGTFDTLTLLDTNGLSNDCTADVANDRIVCTRAGKYRASFSASFSGTLSETFECELYNTTTSTAYTNCHFERKLGTGGDIGSASFAGIVTAAANDVFVIRVACTSGASKSFVLRDGNFNMHKIGV